MHNKVANAGQCLGLCLLGLSQHVLAQSAQPDAGSLLQQQGPWSAAGGAVYLFSFTGGALPATLGYGYSGGKNESEGNTV